MIQFKNLALQDVTFVLCGQRVPFGQFQVLDSREIEIDAEAKTRIAIIGQSHIFQFIRGADTLSEVLLCVPHNLAKYDPICQTTALTHFRLGLTRGCLRYATRITTRLVSTPDAGDGWPDEEDQNMNSLIFHFPQGDMPWKPFTSVRWRVSPAMLAVKTLHTFPDENALVETRTRIWWA